MKDNIDGAVARVREVCVRFLKSKKIYFSDLEPAEKLKGKSGVYAIFDKDDNALYVGRTKNLRQRLCSNHVIGKERSSPIKKYLIKDKDLNDINDFEQAKDWLLANCYFKYIVIDNSNSSNPSDERGHVEGLLGFILNSKYIETEH